MLHKFRTLKENQRIFHEIFQILERKKMISYARLNFRSIFGAEDEANSRNFTIFFRGHSKPLYKAPDLYCYQISQSAHQLEGN